MNTWDKRSNDVIIKYVTVLSSMARFVTKTEKVLSDWRPGDAIPG